MRTRRGLQQFAGSRFDRDGLCDGGYFQIDLQAGADLRLYVDFLGIIAEALGFDDQVIGVERNVGKFEFAVGIGLGFLRETADRIVNFN